MITIIKGVFEKCVSKLLPKFEILWAGYFFWFCSLEDTVSLINTEKNNEEEKKMQKRDKTRRTFNWSFPYDYKYEDF